jgi:hypothetical protein
MTVEEFVTTLRKYRWQEPPEPFIIELTTGKQILIDDPQAVGFIEGKGSFFSPKYEIIEFSHDEVRAIRPVIQEPAS